ncbi:MAG: TetR/AcrR family transcriptional regulator [Thermoleophilaceae bacterium]|nr:TetR/AcrR family transcriptional regulator [Thermoleophilaceae bacterium]
MTVPSAILGPVIGRALSGGVTVSEHGTDQRIIDAVIAELLVTPLRKLALEDVSHRAGVTRMTVYRRFGDREHLIEATFAREVARFLDGVSAVEDPDADPTERVATVFATGLWLAHSHPVVAHWLATSPGDLLETILADDAFIVAAGSAFIATGIGEMSPLRASTEAERQRSGELLARLFAALVLMPPPSVDLTDADQARNLARELIAPLIFPAA